MSVAAISSSSLRLRTLEAKHSVFSSSFLVSLSRNFREHNLRFQESCRHSKMSSNSEVVLGGERGLPSKCICGLEAKIYVSKTQENPGRPFFRCPSKREKHLFKWVEDGVYEEIVEALPKLVQHEREIINAKSEIEELKAMIQDLKDEAMLSKREVCKWKLLFLCFLLMLIVLLFILCGNWYGHKFVLGY